LQENTRGVVTHNKDALQSVLGEVADIFMRYLRDKNKAKFIKGVKALFYFRKSSA